MPKERLILGGERLRRDLITRIEQSKPTCRIFNHYGPTEATIGVSTCEVGGVSACLDSAFLPIGRPLPNATIYILDERMEPQPAGVTGQLWIGGAGVARGYLNLPELTNQRFVTDPFVDSPTARLYQTGDLARFLSDGNIEFLGRRDDQFKLRGFRVELGDIESVLNEHPDVAQCVVKLREDRPGDQRLVAYCVAAADTHLNFAALRSHLATRLPEYMIPATLVVLDKLPLTPSGKIDRRSLPVPDASRPQLDAGYIAPRNPIEQQLVSIWCEVLELEAVGVQDNFFALGGHSLLAMRLHARIASLWQIDLPLRRLFEAPTIAGLASEIETLRRGGVLSSSATLTRVDHDQLDHRPLSFAQQRLWFLEQMEPERTAYNLPYAWRLQGPLDIEALRRALEEVVRRHEPLRTSFAMIDGQPVQRIGTIDRFDLPLQDLSSLPPQQRQAEIVERCRLEAERPFDLSGDLLLRAALLRLSGDEHVLLLTMHQIASDDWSVDVVLDELSKLYEAFQLGRPSPLVGLPMQYVDYAYWQRESLQGELEQRLLDYWCEQLRDAPPTLELPTDRPRPGSQTYHGARESVMLADDLNDSIRRLGQHEGTTTFMTLLAVFQLFLGRLSGQQDLVVGSPIAGRSRTELESLVGLFLNILPLRTDLSGNPTFRGLLSRVRETTLGAYDHQDLPFERLVEALQQERRLDRTPVFQVLFNGLNFGQSKWELSSVSTERISLDEADTKFDLTMYLDERDQGISLQLVYNADLFSRERMVCLLQQYQHLLEQAVAAPGNRIDSYTLVTSQTHQLLADPRVALEAPQQDRVIDQILAHAERIPDQVAICHGTSHWTYQELVESADQLRHCLAGA